MMFSTSAAQMVTITDLGDLPMIVVGSGVPNPAFGESADAFQEFWVDSSQELASLSTRGEFVLAKESGHQLHLEAPDLVMAAIRRLIETVRSMGPR